MDGVFGTHTVGYGPSLAAFAVYLMVVHFIPGTASSRCWSR
jgi:hypothetical protein